MSKTSRFTKHLTALALMALASATPIVLHAQALQVLAPRSGFAPAGPCASILVDPFSPDALILGVRGSPSPADNVVLWLGVDGSSPTTLDSGALNDLRQITYVQNDASAFGTLYAVGQSLGSRFNTWKVRKSSNKGQTWTDDGGVFYLGKGNTSLAQGLASDASGIAYTCGYAYGSAGNDRHWIVRRKFSAGDAWTTVCDLSKKSPGCDALAICANTASLTPAVFAVGTLNYKWTVMRSTDQGVHWYAAGANSWPTTFPSAMASSVACDAAGRIYVAGYYFMGSGYAAGCVVQVSDNGGESWVTLLNDNSSTPTGTWRLAIDSSGWVTLTGKIGNTAGNSRWIVVRPTNPTDRTSWAASYLAPLQPFPDTQSWGGIVAADALGTLFLGGSVDNWNGYSGMGLVRMTP